MLEIYAIWDENNHTDIIFIEVEKCKENYYSIGDSSEI